LSGFSGFSRVFSYRHSTSSPLRAIKTGSRAFSPPQDQPHPFSTGTTRGGNSTSLPESGIISFFSFSHSPISPVPLAPPPLIPLLPHTLSTTLSFFKVQSLEQTSFPLAGKAYFYNPSLLLLFLSIYFHIRLGFQYRT